MFLTKLFVLSVVINLGSSFIFHRRRNLRSSNLNYCSKLAFLDRSEREPNYCETVDNIFIEAVSDGYSKFYCLTFVQNENSRDRFLLIQFENGYRIEFAPNLNINKPDQFSVKLDLRNQKKIVVALHDYFGGKLPTIVSMLLDDKELCNDEEEKEEKEEVEVNDNDEAEKFEVEPNMDLENLAENELNDNNKLTFSCGVRKVKQNPLVAHGSTSFPGQWPWHAAIFHRSEIDSKYKCGGSLVSENFVLTAAHCIFEGRSLIITERLSVHLGKYTLNKFDRFSEEFDVFSIIPHADFNASTNNNDIALLKLSTYVTFSDYIQPICVPSEDFKIVGEIGTVVGWGYNEAGAIGTKLQQVKVPVIDTFKCLESNRDFFGYFLSDKNYCAGYKNGSNACNGDSGGGMYFLFDGIWYLRGLVSMGFRLEGDLNPCEDNDFILYTDVYQFNSWIEQHIF